MSTDVKILTDENNNLKIEVQNYKNGIQSINAQLEASKQMCNESLNSSLNSKTQAIVLNNALREEQTKTKSLQDQLDSLQKLLDVANKKIEELTPKFTDSVSTEQVAA